MIRINLSSLAPPKPKPGKRSTAWVSAPGEGSSTLFLVLFFVVVLAGGIGVSYWWVRSETTRLEAEWKKVTAENQRLAEVKARYEASKRKADVFERRVKAIDDLKKAQQKPTNMRKQGGDTADKNDAGWPGKIDSDG